MFESIGIREVPLNAGLDGRLHTANKSNKIKWTQLCFPGGGQIATKLHRCREFQPNSCGFKPLKPQLATSLTVFGAQDQIHSNTEMANNKDVFFFSFLRALEAHNHVKGRKQLAQEPIRPAKPF